MKHTRKKNLNYFMVNFIRSIGSFVYCFCEKLDKNKYICKFIKFSRTYVLNAVFIFYLNRLI